MHNIPVVGLAELVVPVELAGLVGPAAVDAVPVPFQLVFGLALRAYELASNRQPA